MKPIREQLRAQAGAIREGWAKASNATGYPRYATITLEFPSPCHPTTVTWRTTGRVNSSDACGVPAGYLLFTSIATMGSRRGSTAIDVILRLTYREIPWNHLVLVETATTLGTKPKILVDSAGQPAYPSIDFDELLDELEPPDGRAVEPSGDPGSWRDRPSML